MKDIIKEFNMIDLLGMIFPGSIFMALICSEFQISQVLKAMTGSESVSGILVTVIVFGGYAVGMLLHELGDCFEKIMECKKEFDPKYYITRHYPSSDPKENKTVVDCLHILGVPVSVLFLMFALIAPPLLVDSLLPDLQPVISVIAILVIMFAAVYIAVMLANWLEKTDAGQGDWKKAIQQRGELVGAMLTEYASNPSLEKTESASRIKLFDGFRSMARNLLVMALIFNMFAKFSRPDGVFWQVHELIVGDWRVGAACGCMFFLFSLRYWHYSFLRLKYIAELYQKMHGKSASQPENAAKP